MTCAAQPASGGGQVAGPGGDRIELRGVRVLGTHGVLDEERSRPQPFEIDLDVWLDVGPSAASDDVADTVDYDALAHRAAQVVAHGSAVLLETLAATVAQTVLEADERIATVSATVRKVRPPLALDVSSVGVRAVRHRR